MIAAAVSCFVSEPIANGVFAIGIVRSNVCGAEAAFINDAPFVRYRERDAGRRTRS
jgi:hypothetical protein